jgi:predicted alpha/beta hydrolase
MATRARKQARRASSPPPAGVEDVEVHTSDGRVLRATVREPESALAGVAVLAHAMFARRGEFERPQGAGLAPFLAARGWRTIAFDFRGHGESGPGAAEGASHAYEDLVVHDLPAVVACARDRAAGARVVVVGHSLGGHVAAASQGTGRLGADAIAMFGANVWLRAFEPSLARWAAKHAIARMLDEVCTRRGYFPARALRLGSDDEPTPYMRHISRAVRGDQWGSEDGREDYARALENVRVPVLAIASDADKINCHADCAARFVARVSGPWTFERIRKSDDGGPPPGHMEMVTTPGASSVWARMERWMRDAVTLSR